MGGSGSGTWYRWNKKAYAEDVNRIDIRSMKKQNILFSGSAGSMSWSYNGTETSSISYSISIDKMVLNYRHRQKGGDWEIVTDSIALDEVACHYGGARKWLLCPSCDVRTGVLYNVGKYFRCRKCTGISYASQSEGSLDRKVRKTRKVRRKLDIGSENWSPDCLGDPIYMKPKGMHWQTFGRLKRDESQLQDRINSEFLTKFGMIM